MPLFIYNRYDSYESNFHRWLLMCNKEHREYKELEYSELEGRCVFDAQYRFRKCLVVEKWKQLTLFNN